MARFCPSETSFFLPALFGHAVLQDIMFNVDMVGSNLFCYYQAIPITGSTGLLCLKSC